MNRTFDGQSDEVHCILYRLQGLFTSIRRLFAHLPLAALVQSSTLILHGGLFRAPPKKGKGSKRRRASGALQTQPLLCPGLQPVPVCS
jgi:hypothetical protein